MTEQQMEFWGFAKTQLKYWDYTYLIGIVSKWLRRKGIKQVLSIKEMEKYYHENLKLKE